MFRVDVVWEFVRAAVPVHVLHHAADEEISGAWMAQELARHGYVISPGTLYPLLHRLEEAGLVRSRQVTSGGRVRRMYAATDAGRAEMARLRAAVSELAGEVISEGGRAPGRQSLPADAGEAR